MSELSSIHFLKITGLIERQKKDDFEVAVNFACAQLPVECTEKSLSVEKLFDNQYYFFVSWSTEKALESFIQSNEFQLVRSAYDALGVLQKIEIVNQAQVKTIFIHRH
jgi:hypothetical protein